MSDEAELDRAAAALRQGRVVAAATESFFGLLADASSAQAIEALLRVKPRGHEKGMPLLLPDPDSFAGWVRSVPPLAERLARSLWPGPLTIALSAAEHVDERLLLGGKIAARFPVESPALALARRVGRALTATSANLPGLSPALQDLEVRASFAEAVAEGLLVVVAGRAPGGAPSTVVIIEGDALEVARVGAVSVEEIERARARA